MLCNVPSERMELVTHDTMSSYRAQQAQSLNSTDLMSHITIGKLLCFYENELHIYILQINVIFFRQTRSFSALIQYLQGWSFIIILGNRTFPLMVPTDTVIQYFNRRNTYIVSTIVFFAVVNSFYNINQENFSLKLFQQTIPSPDAWLWTSLDSTCTREVRRRQPTSDPAMG